MTLKYTINDTVIIKVSVKV